MISQPKAKPPILLLHAGAGNLTDQEDLLTERGQRLREVLEQVWPALLNGAPALDTACEAVTLMETFTCMNAGKGAAVQADGVARLSASAMDGQDQKFSAVALATGVHHPARMARSLQTEENAVLGPPGVEALAREMGLGVALPPASALPKPDDPDEPGHGTVGAVALDDRGRLAAVTSTGGFNTNVPGRLSDVSTPAGNYASPHAAISCTGIGEEIVNDGLAVRLETRVRDSQSIIEASDHTLAEARERARRYGWIGVDVQGNWVLYYTTLHMPCIAMSQNMQEPLTG